MSTLAKSESYNEKRDPESGFKYGEASAKVAEAGALGTDAGGLVPTEEVNSSGLDQRHIQMIALAGTIGTGLFLGSGKALAHGGPLSILIGYSAVGTIVVGVVLSLAEMAALVPVSGSYIRHADMWFDPALAFAAGWNVILSNIVSIPAEITAATALFQFWTDLNPAIFITILVLCVAATNAFSVRFYGELEFSFAILKIITILGLILFGLCIDFGAGPHADGAIGFRYWNNPGPMAEYLVGGASGRFVGFWAVLTSAIYAFSGVETVAMAAAETKSPRRNIPIAARRIFVRVFTFYVLGVFVIGLIVPSNDAQLINSSGTASASPFVVAANRAGVKVLPSLLNAIIITSAWSSANSSMLNGSRALYGMALDGNAPKIFKRVHRWGVPYVGVCLLLAFMPLAYMTLGSSATQAFGYLSDIVSTVTLLVWLTICSVFLRYYKGVTAQGINRDELPYKSPFQPYLAWFALVFCAVCLLTQGFTLFLVGEWDTPSFVTNYLAIPIFAITFVVVKLVRGSKMVAPEDMRIAEFIQHYKENPEPEPEYAPGVAGKFQKLLYG